MAAEVLPLLLALADAGDGAVDVGADAGQVALLVGGQVGANLFELPVKRFEEFPQRAFVGPGLAQVAGDLDQPRQAHEPQQPQDPQIHGHQHGQVEGQDRDQVDKGQGAQGKADAADHRGAGRG